MLYLMCAAGRSLQGSEARNNDENFVTVAGKGPSKSQSQPKSKAERSLSQAGGGVPDSGKPSKSPADPKEQQDRGRSERGAKRAVYAPGSGAPLQRMPEASRESSLRRSSPPSGVQGQPGRASKPSSRESSTSGRPQTSSEAKGKQKATQIGSERRPSPAPRGASRTGQAEAPRARSRSSQRRGREQQRQGPHGREGDDLYGVSDEEDRRTMAIPVRPSRGRSPQPPLPQPPPPSAAAPRTAPAVRSSSSSASTQGPAAPASTQTSAEVQSSPVPQLWGPRTRRSNRERAPTSPKEKLKKLFKRQ